jgi:hypothetical protein
MTADAIESTSSARPPRQPWSRGKLIGQKPPLKPREVWAIRIAIRYCRWLAAARDHGPGADLAGDGATPRAAAKSAARQHGAMAGRRSAVERDGIRLPPALGLGEAARPRRFRRRNSIMRVGPRPGQASASSR